ncbi:hypothetical protein Cni_G05044 [Canna indica]|uniref:Uncharacterized protein n=1 Tax=Canna indica TaxID=4628 RepID=A0AAQ3JUH6_9LILI|nr:hypothetical protein Cni_G05044 [Canna indica]
MLMFVVAVLELGSRTNQGKSWRRDHCCLYCQNNQYGCLMCNKRITSHTCNVNSLVAYGFGKRKRRISHASIIQAICPSRQYITIKHGIMLDLCFFIGEIKKITHKHPSSLHNAMNDKYDWFILQSKIPSHTRL